MTSIDPAALALAKDRTAQAVKLFRAGSTLRALEVLRDVEKTHPFYTPAITWQIPILDALGEFRQVRRLYDFPNSVLTFDLSGAAKDAEAQLANDLALAIARKVRFGTGTKRMPLVSAQISNELSGLRNLAIVRFRATLLKYFRRYLRQARFRNRHIARIDDCWLSFWSTRTPRRGSIGPHYHARSWISWVFYPSTPLAGSRICSGGELEFGHVPAIMGTLRKPCIFRVRPQPGTLIVFPAYIGHAVTPVRSMHARISIAGDLGLVPRRTKK